MKVSLPNGLYRGSREGYTGNWKGKFFSSRGKGINIFHRNGKNVKVYPFKYYRSGKVIAVDYDVKGNPWWLRLVLDELTPQGKGRYQGRLIVRMLGLQLRLISFSLHK